MSKYLILCDDSYYPSILVLEDKYDANTVYGALKYGYVDYSDEIISGVDYNVQMVEVEQTSLKTCDWSGIQHSPVCEKIVFL